MKHPRLSAALGLLGLACVGSMALHPQKAAADPHGIGNPLGAASQGFFQGFFLHGASYLTTITTTTGAFEARGVLTFHADSTVSATSSAQGGFFSSQLGSWKPDGEGGLVARTIDFDFPPNADVARLDWTVKFAADGTQVKGTVTLTTFPLTGNPLDGGGTLAGQFTFVGNLVKP
jgi:hypothetical protein